MRLFSVSVSGFFGFERGTTVDFVDNKAICVGGMMFAPRADYFNNFYVIYSKWIW